MYVEIQTEAAPQDILPHQATGSRLGDRLFEDPRTRNELASNIDKGDPAPDGETGQHDPLDKLVRVPHDQLPIFERPRLALIGITDEILGQLRILGNKAPFDAGREACASPPPEP